MDDYEITDCTGVLTGNAQFDTDYMRQCAWTPSDTTPERVPQETELPKALAFAGYAY